MSKVVDERVVEMRFDNADFEKNVKNSMTTLDKLKEKLKLSDSSKGLENLGKAANNVRFDGMISGINTVNTRFSYMQGIIMHQLNNIADTCVRVGKNMVAALTINPVKDGFKEYETQMNAVQTILANTQKEGTNVKIVNAALDELNHYADKTIYNFTEMTRNIGTFTAAGVKLDTSVSAIKGIANLAAVSGSTSQQASTAMYQLSQAIASGTVKLMDWNSVVNAGMGGQVFQDALVRTSEHLQTGAKAAIEAEGSFRESLSTGWLTTEVLTETLDMFSTAADTQAEYEAAVQKFLSKGYTQEEAKQMADMARTAGEAATKVKTFTQLIDTLKEALGSGWTETWRLIIGDFEEARTLWTGISDVLSDFINKVSDARNRLIESAMGKSFSELSEKIKSAIEPAKQAMETVQNVGTAIADLGGIVDDVIIGKFGDGEERFNALTEAGINWYEVQNKVNEKLGDSKRYTQEQIDAQNKLLGVQSQSAESAAQNAEATGSLTDAQKAQLKELMKLSSAQLRSKGYSEEQIKAFNELRKTADKLGIPIDKFIDKLDQINGRWLMIEGFKNIGRAIVKVFSSMAEAAQEVFDAIKPETIFNALSAFHKLTASLILSDENADKLKRTFKGLFAALDFIKTLAGGAVSIAFKVLSKALGATNLNILDFTARIGDAIVKIKDFLENNKLINGAIELLVKGFEKIAEVVGNAINAIIDNPITKEIANIWDQLFGDKDIKKGQGIVTTLKDLGNAMDISKGKANNFKTIIDGINSAFNISNWKWAASLTSTLKLVDAVLGLFGTDLANVGADIAKYITQFGNWVNVNTIFINMGSKIAAVLKVIIEGISRCIQAFMNLPQVQQIIQNFRDALTNLFGDISKGINGFSIDGITNQIKNAFNTVTKYIESLKDSEHLGLDIVLGICNGIKSGIGIAANAILTIGETIMKTFCTLLGIHSPSKWGFDRGVNIVEGICDGIKSVLNLIDNGIRSVAERVKSAFSKMKIDAEIGNLFDSIKKIYTNFMDLVKSIDLTKILAVIPVAITVMFAKRIWELLTVLESGIKGINNVIANFAEIEKNFSKVLTSMATDIKAKAVQKLAVSLAILVGSIIALALVDAKYHDNLVNATVMIGVMAGILAALSFAINKLDAASIKLSKEKGLDVSGLKTTLLQIGAVMLMLATSVKIMGSMNPDEMKQGFIGLAGAVGAISAVFVAFGVLAHFEATKDIDKAGGMILKVSVAMLLMVGVCKLASKLEWKEMGKASVFALGFSAFVAALAGCYRLAGNDINKLGGTVLKITFALGLMVGVCKLIAKLEWKEMGKGLAFVSGFSAFVAALKLISQMFPQAQMQKISGMMISMTVALGLMVGVCKLISKLSAGEMIKGAAFTTGFILLVGLLVKLTKISNTEQMAKVAGTIIGMSVAVGAMAAVCVLMSLLTDNMLLRGIAAVRAFATMMAIMIGAARGVTDIKGTIMMMAVSIGIMAGAVAALTFLDQGKLKSATACLSLLMGMFALMERQSSKIQNSAVSLGIMAATIGVIGYVIYQLSSLPTTGALVAAASVSAVMVSLGIAMGLIGKYGAMSTRAMVSVGVMTLALYGISKIIGVLMNMQGTENAIKVSASLAIMLLGLSTSMMILSKMSDSSIDTKGLLKFVVAVGTLTLALSALAPALQSMGTVGWDSLAKAGVALAGLAVGLNLMNGTLGGAAALLVAAGALTVLAPVLERLGAMSTDSIVRSLIALGGAFAIIGVAGALLTPVIVPIIALSAALAVLGVAALAFGGGIALLGKGLRDVAEVGSSAAKELVKSIETITTGILNLIPKITKAMTQAIVAVCQVFIDSAPKIGEAAVALLLSVMESLLNSKAQMIDTLTTLVVAVLNGLSDKLPEMVDALSKFVVTLINQLASHMPEFIKAGVNLISQIVSGIVDNLDQNINNIVVPLLSAFGDILSKVFTAIGPYIPDIVNGFIQIADAVCNMVARITEAIAPFIPNIENIVQLVINGVSQVCGAFTNLVNQIAPVIQAIAGLVRQLGDSITQILYAIRDNVAQLGESISSALSSLGGAFESVGNSIRTALDGVADIITAVGDAIKKSMDGVAEDISSVGEAIESAFRGIGDIVDSVGSGIRKVLDGISGIIDSIGQAALNAGTGFEKLAGGLGTISSLNIKDVVSSIGSIAKSIGDISAYSDGIASVGTGMQQLMTASQTSAGIFSTMSMNVQSLLVSLQSIGPTASASMTTLVSAVNSSATCFTLMSSTAVTAMSTMMNGMATTVLSQSSLITSAINVMMNSAVASISGKQAIFMSAGIGMMNGLYLGIISAGGRIPVGIATVVVRASTMVMSQRGIFMSAGVALMVGLSSGIISGSVRVLTVITSFINRSYTFILSKRGQFQSAGLMLIVGLANGIRSGASSINNAIASAMSSCSSAIRSHRSSFQQAGSYLGQGLVIGIRAQQSAAYRAGYELGRAAVQGEKAGQQSHSPSKATQKAGRWLGEGLVIGMEQMGKTVYKTGKSMGTNAVESISGALSSINNVSDMDMGFAPSITPVVDMGEIQNGSRNLQIGANLSASLLSKPVNSLQEIVSNAQADINASNNEVIKAINDLRADLNALYAGDDTELALYMDSKKVASTLAKPMNRQLLTLQKRGSH